MVLAHVGRDDEVGHEPAHDLASAPAEGPLGRRIELGHQPGIVDGDDAVERSLQHRHLAGLAGPHRGLGPRSRGELAQLAPDGGHDLDQVGVGRLPAPPEDLQDAEDLLAGCDRHGDRGVNPVGAGCG